MLVNLGREANVMSISKVVWLGLVKSFQLDKETNIPVVINSAQ